MTKELFFISDKLEEVNWNHDIERKQYWDELLLPHLPEIALYAQILKNNSEIYEFDDISDIKKFEEEQRLKISI